MIHSTVGCAPLRLLWHEPPLLPELPFPSNLRIGSFFNTSKRVMGLRENDSEAN